jgi:hypothetical protein
MRKGLASVAGATLISGLVLVLGLAPAGAGATGGPAPGTINVFAGNGATGSSGDGGPAGQAELSSPQDATTDASGNAYVADSGNCEVRKVSPSGTISRFAGTGTCPTTTTSITVSGLGGPAVDASIGVPTGVAVDPSGNVYIADCTDYQTGSPASCVLGTILKVSPNGIITNFAGNGTYGYTGDGGPATAAEVEGPWGVATDSAGNVYFSDMQASVVRRVTTSGIITTVAGNGFGGYSGDNGPATTAELNGPRGIFVDTSGNLLIADSANFRVRKVSPNGIITTLAGNGTANTSRTQLAK